MAFSYKQTKPEEKYDCIIIGSGLSGTALAAILARDGKRCLVLERHYTAGGFTHTFSRRNYEWDVGVHYVGQMQRGAGMLSKVFDYITDGSLEWADMGDPYDCMWFGEQAFAYAKGRGQFVQQMKEYFPSAEDGRAIDAYMDLTAQAARRAGALFTTRALPPFLNRMAGGLIARKAMPFARSSTLEVLNTITHNEQLIGVLTGQYGDYGLPPDKSSFLMHAILFQHYLDGGYYPVGGAGSILASIEPVIESSGGEVYTNAEVKSVLTERGKATGVVMVDGAEFRAPVIVSAAGVHNTYSKLLFDRAAPGNVLDIGTSVGHLCLYIGLRTTPTQLQLPKTNYWIYPAGYDHDASVSAYMKDPEHAPLPLVYISFPSAKDPDWEKRYRGRSTIEVITLSNAQWFTRWAEKPWMNRGADYEAIKRVFTARLLDVLYRYVPQVKGKIDHCELSTPLSTRHFTGYTSGEIYGLEHSPQRFSNREISAYTPVRNCFLTGQDIVTCGIGGALMSGVLTAMVITGRRSFSWIVNAR